jgi:phage terminase large subunit
LYIFNFLKNYFTVDQAKKKKIAEAREHGLPLPPSKKKNVQPPRKHRDHTDNSGT